jgi:AcrR family transcriptional regulator
MDALARAARVSRPVVYEHFAGREALIVALIDAHAEFLRARVEAALRDAGTDLESRIRRTVHAYFDSVEVRGRGLRALLAASGSSPVIDAARARARRWGTEEWSSTIRSYAGLSSAEAAAVAGAITASVWLLAEHWLAGSISRRRAEEIHVRMTLGQLDALRRRDGR